MPLVFSLLVIAFSVVTLIDIVTRDDSQVKHLPKLVWIVLAIIIPIVGGIVWWAAGREYPPRPQRVPSPGFAPASGMSAPVRTVDARSTEQQLADLEREIQIERMRAEVARRKRERGEA